MPFFYVCNPVNSKKSIVFVFSLTCHRIGLFGPQSTLSPCPCEARHEFSNHMAGSAILGVYWISRRYEIDLFSLYVLFSQYRSCDNTLKNCVFQISSCSRAYVRIIYEKTKGQVPLGPPLGKKRTTSRGLLLNFSKNSLRLSFYRFLVKKFS